MSGFYKFMQGLSKPPTPSTLTESQSHYGGIWGQKLLLTIVTIDSHVAGGYIYS